MKLKAAELVRLAKKGMDFRQAHPIVISNELLKRQVFRDTEDQVAAKAGGLILDCPFEIFTIEVTDAPVWGFALDDTLEVWTVDCIICQELTVGLYKIGVLVEHPVYAERKFFWMSELDKADNDTYWSDSCLIILEYVLGQLQRAPLGKIVSDSSSGYKHQGRRRSYAPKDVIYIGTKDERKKNKVSGGHVDWTHRWQVRGHWRKFDGYGLGLDRKGQRTVEGYTWIKPHIKGQGELIEKVRVFS